MSQCHVCVECGAAVQHVYREFSPGNIRLTQCDVCGMFADKYVEYEPLLLCLDLMLIKAQPYRHCLYNMGSKKIMRAMLKLLPAMVCFDVYTQWVRLQRLYSSPLNPLIQPRIHQAMQDAARDGRPFVWPQERQTTIIIIEFALTAVYWMAVLLAAWMWKGDERRSESVVANDKQEQRSTADAYQSTGDIASAAAPPLPSSLPSPFPSTPLLLALLLSSFGKFFALIPLVWASEYHHFDGVAAAIKTFVACSNVKAVQVHLRISMFDSILLILFGLVARLCLLYSLHVWDPLIIPYELWI